jgi:hypothetical protein
VVEGAIATQLQQRLLQIVPVKNCDIKSGMLGRVIDPGGVLAGRAESFNQTLAITS